MAERIKGTNTIDVEGLKDLNPGSGVRIGDTKYEYGASLETEGTPLIDPGTGKTVSIRVFHFKMEPSRVKSFPVNDKQAIFNSHATQIKTILWGDGLIPIEGISPRVIVDKKKMAYNIFVPCEARLNVMWADRPKNLSVELAKGEVKGRLEKPKTQ